MKTKKGFLLKALSLLCALLMLTCLFAGCVGNCEHVYVNGVCTECGTPCPHESYKNGKCEECRTPCLHESYSDGVCETCGTVCKHTSYKDGACETCGKACPHTKYEFGFCTVCKIECKHESYKDGECTTCGTACTHKFNGNTCSICGAEKFVDPSKPEAHYDYQPYLSEQLPCIYVQSDTFLSDATRYVGSYDNDNPLNNIDWQYHDCTVTVNNCDDAYALTDIEAGIKVRGNWTTTYDKKPFRIKFNKKQSMLGLNDGAKMKSWVLLAEYKDCSLARNSVAYYLGQQILSSDGYYCTDYRPVKLYLNNQYWGLYLLAEQQQVNENRINITEPSDPKDSTAKEHLDTNIGYFIEFDGYYNLELYNERFALDYGSFGSLKKKDGGDAWISQNGFTIKSDVYEDEDYRAGSNAYNKGEEGRYPQKNFIKNYMYNLYKICYNAVKNHRYYTFNSDFTDVVSYKPTSSSPVQETVSKVIDIQSLVDTYILNEIVCDYDIEWSSFLMDVDFGPNAKDNLLRFEAPWDFDSAFALRDRVESGTGLYAANSNNPWLIIFINEDWFWNKVKDKWREMSSENVQQNVLQYVKTLRSMYASDYEENFDRWGFVVSGEAVWDLQTNRTHQYWSDYLYNWLNKRFSYLNTVWK